METVKDRLKKVMDVLGLKPLTPASTCEGITKNMCINCGSQKLVQYLLIYLNRSASNTQRWTATICCEDMETCSLVAKKKP